MPDLGWRINTHHPARTCLAKSASSLRNQYKHYSPPPEVRGDGVLLIEPTVLLHICADSRVLWALGWCLRPLLLFLSTMADGFGHASYAHSPQGLTAPAPAGDLHVPTKQALLVLSYLYLSASFQNSKRAMSTWCGD